MQWIGFQEECMHASSDFLESMLECVQLNLFVLYFLLFVLLAFIKTADGEGIVVLSVGIIRVVVVDEDFHRGMKCSYIVPWTALTLEAVLVNWLW